MFQTRQEEQRSPSAMAPTGGGSKTERSSVSIVHVPPRRVVELWPHLQRAFRRAQGTALGDRMDEVEILARLCDGSKELLVAARGDELVGGVILEWVERPRGRCCIVVVSLFNSWRDVSEWSAQMSRHICEYAKRERGCYTVEANVRDGVVPLLERLGWRRKATAMEIRL